MPFDTAHADDVKQTNRTKLIIKVFFLFLITLILRFDFIFILFSNVTKKAKFTFLTYHNSSDLNKNCTYYVHKVFYSIFYLK
ncbi:hypothetical protein DW966_09975 [Bacteroides stercoris]|uniref:Uncharacterized protein n=1 Tax=Bacteroides stercoris TaxID=46506 RepID=A0A412DQW4_BACSE|nr:hypothetical protein DWY65_04800 [Bacteroides stercoris]RGZ91412.1 hypothetical protein DW966_09975 [Bacteroides stercoris]